MAHDERDGTEDRSTERRRKDKKERDPDSHHKSKKSRTKIIDPVTGETVKTSRRKREKEKDSEIGKSRTEVSMADTAPEISKTMSRDSLTSRASIPYPTFSKAHSKEAVSSVPKLNVYTPDPTDLDDALKKARSADSLKKSSTRQKNEAPPSPPDTEAMPTATASKATTTGSRVSKLKEERSSRETSRSAPSGSSDEDSSKSTYKSKGSTSTRPTKSKSTRASTLQDDDVRSFSKSQQSNVDSNATSVAPGKSKSKKPPPAEIRTSDPESSSAEDSSPQTPTQTPSPYLNNSGNPNTTNGSAVPPPPPPPPTVPVSAPRVDYLLQNGGLPRPIRKALFDKDNPITNVFNAQGGFFDQILSVLDRKGSLAVATGYRSVARRLLDRLEVVMGRELKSDDCTCVVCREAQKSSANRPATKQLGWGEVLERVSGRIELPIWPPFEFSVAGMKATEAGLRSHYGPPRPGEPIMVDPDIAEEFRGHYLQQNEKKKKTIDHWLSSCPTPANALPEGLDEETLSFTILTHIEDTADRPLYHALMAGSSEPWGIRAPTPLSKPRPEFIKKTAEALQRLYHLPKLPRDCETCLYLIKNPDAHNLLMTLNAIGQSEWEILTSGRFDGFLWSGAESEFPSMNNSPNVSRNPTPANGHFPFDSIRNPTPSKFSNSRTSISNDEEMEMAINAEIERNIYQDMDALEDVFEELHRKAETVRQALRARNAALLYSRSQPRVVCGTPGLQTGYEGTDDSPDMSESDSGWYNPQESELGPNDSASVIAPNRFRRPKRRNDRRTPALAEEDEGGA